MDWSQIDLGILHFFNGSDNIALDDIVVSLTNGFVWIPLFLSLIYLIIKNNETMAQIMLAIGGAILCVLVTDGIDDGIVKPMIGRLRPLNDPMVRMSLDLVSGVSERSFSFFSAHAANTMGIAVFFCWLVRSRMVGFLLVSWSLINCWTRLYLGVHYPSDILVGIICGALVGSLVYFLYRKLYFKISPKLHYVSTQYTKTGYDYNDIDVVMVVTTLTLLVIVVKSVIVF